MRFRGRTLRAGMSGSKVTQLHAELAAIGYEIPGEERSGAAFGAGTTRAVAQFQRAHGLSGAGVVDARTAEVLRRLVSTAITTTGVPRPSPRESQRPIEPREEVSAVERAPEVVTRGHGQALNAATATLRRDLAPTALRGVLIHADPDADLRVVVSHEADPTRRWTPELDEQGRFSVAFEPVAELRSGPKRIVPLVVRVLNRGHVVSRTRVEVVPEALAAPEVRIVVPVEDGIWLGGSVKTRAGGPAAGLDVVVAQVLLDRRSEIARARTDERGQWQAQVRAPDEPLDLTVAVLAADGTRIVSGPVHSDVRMELVEMLTVPDEAVTEPSLYEHLRGRYNSILAGVDPVLLAEEAVDVAASRLGVEPDALRQLRDSARWAATGTPEAVAFALAAGGGLTPSSVLRSSDDDLTRQLASAVRARVVPDQGVPLEGFAAALRASAADLAVEEPQGRARRSWLESVGVPADLARAVVRGQLLAGPGADPPWDELARRHAARGVHLARVGAELSGMGLDHVPLVRVLARRVRDAATLGAVLPALRPEDLDAMLEERLDGRTVGAPEGIDRRSYIRGVMRRIERRFPTATALHQWSRLTSNPMLADVVGRNPNLDLGRAMLTPDRDEVVIPPGAERAAVLSELRLAQRLYALAPAGRRVETMAALHAAGFSSAAAITDAGPHMFARAVGDRLDVPTARRVFELASQRSAMASALVMRHTASLEALVVGGPWQGTTATLENLFGPMSFCGCEHCQSVLSPAAYLAELLAFLRRIPADQGSALDALTTGKRRGDVRRVRLDCPNTTTPMPYIDLVNELLEDRLAPFVMANLHGTGRQTTRTEQELRAHPEHLNVPTYVELRDSVVFPMALPFDLFFTEVRAYLAKLGVSWADLLDAFVPAAGQTAGAARLGLCPAQARVVAGQHPGSLESMWGVADLGELASVERFLDRAAISYDALRQLLATRYFQTPVLTLDDPLGIDIEHERPCQVTGAKLTNLPSPLTNLMNRTHRLIRLWHGCGWSLRELDLAIANVGGGAITHDTLANLGRVAELSARMPSVGRLDLLAWWGPIETNRGPDGADSRYDALFLTPANRTLRPAVQPGMLVIEPLSLDSSRTELSLAGQQLRPLLPRLAAALQAHVDVLTSLADALGLSHGNLATLSSLFRYVSFARAAALTPADVHRWSVVLGIDAFASPAETLRYLAARQRALDLGATLDGLSYAIGQDEPASTAPDDGTLARWLAGAVVAMRDSHRDLGADATSLDMLGAELDSLLEAQAAARVMALFGSAGGQADPGAVLEAELGAWLDAGVRGQAAALLAGGSVDEATTLVAEALAPAAQAARMRAACANAVAMSCGADPDVVDLLLSLVPVDLEGGGGTLRDGLTAAVALDVRETPGDAGWPPELMQLVPPARRWHRGVVLLKTLGLGAEPARWLVDHADAMSALAPHRLGEPGEVSPNSAAALARTIAFAGATKRNSGLFADAAALYEAVLGAGGGALPAPVRSLMAPIFGWDLPAASGIAAQLGLSTADMLDGTAVMRIDEALSLLAAGDLDAAQVIGWVSHGPTEETAADVKLVVTGRVTPQDWADELGPVRDAIREQQRDALVAAYLETRPDLDAPGDIYGDLLVDAEVNACRTASRIQQAVAAVQRFVNRIEAGQEPGLMWPEALRREWTWMSAYRVWEANRKVYLWPENWLDPKLRLDRTPLFDEATRRLSGTELTDADGEHVVRDYVYGLRAIDRLQVAGLHLHGGRLHVFARSRDATRRWYHRVHQDRAWGPWRDVPLQIDAPEVLPLTHQDQLMLVWPKLQERAPEGEDQPANAFTDVRLAWAFQEDTGWSEVHETGGDVLVSDEDLGDGYRLHADYRYVVLTAGTADGALRIEPTLLSSWRRPALNRFVADRCGQTFHVSEVEDPFGVYYLRPVSTSPQGQSFYGTASGPVAALLRLPLPQPVTEFPENTSPLVNLGVGNAFRLHSCLQPLTAKSRPGFDITKPSVLEDRSRTFLLWPRPLIPVGRSSDDAIRYSFRFELLYHPFACELIQQLHAAGVEGIYRPDPDGPAAGLRRQRAVRSLASYEPGNLVEGELPAERFDFSASGAYGEYNWELFLHIPLMVAAKLRAAGRFADAKRWLERVFQPNPDPEPGSPDPAAWHWLPNPLWQEGKSASIEDDLALLSKEELSASETARRDDLVTAISRWRQRPFEPHVIARLRPGAYQRQTVMAYLDTLIAWGDSLFSQRTAEALDEATQLYLLAADLLGPRPTQLPERDAPALSFDELDGTQDPFGNFVVENIVIEVENQVPGGRDDGGGLTDDFAVVAPLPPPSEIIDSFADLSGPGDPPPPPSMFWVFVNMKVTRTRRPYFCIPANEKLLGYWDTIEDRMFKLRNCLDLQGQRLVPDLFAPPIDPGALVAAIAQGIDLASAIEDLFAPLPHYRFHAALAKAKDFTALVRDLGRTVLAAIERADSESFALLGNAAEAAVLEAVGDVHQQRVMEATEHIEVLRRARDVTDERVEYYAQLLDQGLLEDETAQRESREEARSYDEKSAKRQLAAGTMHSIPSTYFSLFSNPIQGAREGGVTTTYGTPQIAAAISTAAEFNTARARRANTRAELQGADAANTRREQEWTFLKEQAEGDRERIDAELAAAQARVEIARRELKVHQRNVNTNRQVLDFLSAKYTQRELHDWMSSSATALHQSAFALALDLARKAQRAFRYELAEPNATFVNGGYWESHRNGLLAGERLVLDLDRMEASYLENNRREHELVKRVSLAQIDPGALLHLRYSGTCEFTIPEVLFDLDHPTHFLRRLRRVSGTLPAVAGPYTNVNATLTLLRSETRPAPGAEPVIDFAAGSQTIAMSTGQSDAGMFADDPTDSRRLPFEGRGAVSRWQLTLPEHQVFDYRTIADFILELRYTARSGAAAANLPARLNERALAMGSGWARSFSARADFPDAWQAFRQPTLEATRELRLLLEDAHYPFPLTRGASRRLRHVRVFAETTEAAGQVGPVGIAGATATATAEFAGSAALPGMLSAMAALADDAVGTLTLTFPTTFDPAAVRDVIVLVEYDVNP